MSRHPGDYRTRGEIRALLNDLSGSDPGPAWADFIDGFSPHILKLVRQFEYEQGRADDCFLYVCEKLCESRFRRLLKFNNRGKASFGTWLGSVVFNLCVDWHRREFGRAMLLPAITALPEFDQSVYRLRFEQEMDLQTCLNCLREDFPDLQEQQLSESVARIHKVLTPRQRWKLGVRRSRRKRPGGVQRDPDSLPGSVENPEVRASTDEVKQLLYQALECLPREQRLAVTLRYIQGMTLGQVAESLGLGDPFRARRLIQVSLDNLSKSLPASARIKTR